MADYEARRRANIQKNQSLVENLGLKHHIQDVEIPRKRRPRGQGENQPTGPTRKSARLAQVSSKPQYDDESTEEASEGKSSHTQLNREKRGKKITSHARFRDEKSLTKRALVAPKIKPNGPSRLSLEDLATIVLNWTSWTPVADPPIRDENGVYHFSSHPGFSPNKSPEEIIREGSFGGSYWRPLYSAHLATTISDDWRELPSAWTEGLDVGRYLTNSVYGAETNKFGVACGQSIEEWEKSGWIAHEFDVRGWFQWYCRFWMGRRCPDGEDDRQIGRWKKCVGERGRWKRALLKQYGRLRIKKVADEGLDDMEEAGREVSPVIHQTCHHWAWELRQVDLDQYWEEVGG